MLNALPTRHIQRFASGALLAAAALLAGPAGAASPEQSSTSREARDDAIESIPFDKLSKESRDKLREVVSKPSIYRRLPTQSIDCDPELYLFLIRYPEVVVNIWELMGITNVSAKRAGPFKLTTSDGAGTTSNVELIYGTQDTHVLYCEGVYEGPLFKRKINGKCVLLLKSVYTKDKDERVQIANRLDMFLQLDNVGADILAKTLHPLVGKAADHNFLESALFLGRISHAAEKNATGFQKMSARLTNVEPSVRERFAEIATAINTKAAERNGLAGEQDVEVDVIRTAQESQPKTKDPARRITVPR